MCMVGLVALRAWHDSDNIKRIGPMHGGWFVALRKRGMCIGAGSIKWTGAVHGAGNINGTHN